MSKHPTIFERSDEGYFEKYLCGRNQIPEYHLDDGWYWYFDDVERCYMTWRINE